MEKHFKNLFKEHELPYDSAAWEQFSKRLDVVMPVKKASSNWKWYLGSLAILLSVTGLVWKLTSQNSIIHDSSTHTSSATDAQRSESNETKPESGSTPMEQNVSSFNQKELNGSIVTAIKEEVKETVVSNNGYSSDAISDKTNTRGTANNEYQVQQKNSDPLETGAKGSILIPAVKDLCEGEGVWIKNENTQDLFLTDNSKVFPISAGNRIYFTGENPGTYYFGQTVNGKIQYSKTPDFKVKEGVKADFTIDSDAKYEQGIPTITLQASSTENASYSWKIEGSKSELKGKEVKAHLYQKGNYEVVLTAEPKDNSCPASIKKQIRIEEDYNLLAVNSFWPNSSDPRNATFMPYALKERSVDFTMLIIDPTNGVTLFETNDATNGWTGINKTNGQLVDANKTYIWVVRIKNPLPDEKAEYKGTIVRLP